MKYRNRVHPLILMGLLALILSLGFLFPLDSSLADGTSAVPFDCRAMLLSKAVRKNVRKEKFFEYRSSGYRGTDAGWLKRIASQQPIPLHDPTVKRISGSSSKEVFDFINAADLWLGHRGRDADSFGHGQPLPYDFQRQESLFAPDQSFRYDQFGDWMDTLSPSGDAKDYLRVHAIIRELNSNVCERCFCRPNPKHRASAETDLTRLHDQYDLVSLEEAQALVEARFRAR